MNCFKKKKKYWTKLKMFMRREKSIDRTGIEENNQKNGFPVMEQLLSVRIYV